MDESHLFYSRKASASPYKARVIPALNRWCVTAIPMTSSSSELHVQAHYLDMPYDHTCRLITDADFLKTHMIRHMKSQRINGATALALPKSTSSIKMIQMTPREENAYLGKIAV